MHQCDLVHTVSTFHDFSSHERGAGLAIDHLDEKQGTEDAKWLEDKRKYLLEEKVLPQFHRATVRALES